MITRRSGRPSKEGSIHTRGACKHSKLVRSSDIDRLSGWLIKPLKHNSNRRKQSLMFVLPAIGRLRNPAKKSSHTTHRRGIKPARQISPRAVSIGGRRSMAYFSITPISTRCRYPDQLVCPRKPQSGGSFLRLPSISCGRSKYFISNLAEEAKECWTEESSALDAICPFLCLPFFCLHLGLRPPRCFVVAKANSLIFLFRSGV